MKEERGVSVDHSSIKRAANHFFAAQRESIRKQERCVANLTMQDLVDSRKTKKW
jgi:transposase-like protein